MANDTGKFVWHDHASSEKDKAQKFYADALGWKVKEQDVGGGHKYHMITHTSGKDIGGYTDEKSAKHWLSYIQVANVDDTVKAIEGKDGKSAGARDIGEHGRMAVVTDPFGATFALWQMAEKKAPAEETKKRGGRKAKEVAYDEIWTWHEVTVPVGKSADALTWYSGIFGWESTTASSSAGSDHKYHLFNRKGEKKPFAGLTEATKENSNIVWTAYIGSDDVEATLNAAKDAGANIVKTATTVSGGGTFGIFTDTTGVVVGIFQPAGAEAGATRSSKRKPAKKPASQPKKKKAKKNDDDDDYADGEDD